MLYLELILNLSLLVALSVISDFIDQRYARRTRKGIVLQGVLFGGAAIIAMLHPLVIKQGLIVDGRTVMLSLCTLFYGPWAGAIAAAAAVACRLQIAGPGVVTGILTIVSSAGIGWIAYRRWTAREVYLSVRRLFLLGVIVHCTMLILMLALPRELIRPVLSKTWLPILLFFPPATVLAGQVLFFRLLLTRSITTLREARSHLAATLNSIADGVITIDMQGRVEQLNPVAERITGWQDQEAHNRQLTEVLTLVDPYSGRRFHNVISTLQVEPGFNPIINHADLVDRNGVKHQIAVHSSPLHDTEGRLTGAVLVLGDVEKELNAIRSLREREALFRKLFEDHATAKLIIDPQTNLIVDANVAATRLYGWSREELTAKPPRYLCAIPPELCPNKLQNGTPDCGTQEKLMCRHRTAAGAILDVEVFRGRININGKELYQSDIYDVTERKRTEQALQQSERHYQVVLEVAIDGFTEMDRQGRFIYTNPVYSRMTGYTAAELAGMSIYDLVVPDTPEEIPARLQALWELGGQRFESRYRHKDGHIFNVEVSSQYCGDRLISFVRDISERKHHESELQKLRTAIEQSNEMVVITNAAGVIEYTNPAFELTTGYSSAEVRGATPRILKSGRHNQAFYQELWATILGGGPWNGRLVNRRKDGTTYEAECFISPIKDQSGKVVNFAWISHDITQEIELEKRVAEAQRLEAIGALAGGIAHDFNNLLFPIMGLSEMLMMDLPQESPSHEYVTGIYNAALRAGELVRQILSFSRQAEHIKVPVRLQQILKEVYKLIRSTITANIEVIQDLKNDCAPVFADPTQIHQIVMNLITNAFHAVESGGGKISIRLTEVEPGSNHNGSLLLASAKCAAIQIADTGYGIDPAIIDKIFEPYFTTKPQGKGTGLGLAATYGIVKEHGGEISVSSHPGQGTTFTVLLPLIKSDPAESRPAAPSTIVGGSERILLVDDEAAVVELVGNMLRRLGYRVEARTSSIEALQAFRAGPERFDLVFSDMAMPNMTGLELARELQKIRRGIPVIICTGFSENMDRQTATAAGVGEILNKPVLKNEMAAAIRRLIDGR